MRAGHARGAGRRWPGVRSAWAAGAVALTAITLAAAVLAATAAPAGAEAEWCDTGSPPPNDFRLRPTGTGSRTSPPMWLRSTTNGATLLATFMATGAIDVSQVATLQGGVATGMAHAKANKSAVAPDTAL